MGKGAAVAPFAGSPTTCATRSDADQQHHRAVGEDGRGADLEPGSAGPRLRARLLGLKKQEKYRQAPSVRRGFRWFPRRRMIGQPSRGNFQPF
jgi:hypothetical protein